LLGKTGRYNFVFNSYSSTFAVRLEGLIKECSVSRNKLAGICKVTSSNVSKWLLNGQLPKPDIICVLAQYFNCSVDYLLGRVAYR